MQNIGVPPSPTGDANKDISSIYSYLLTMAKNINFNFNTLESDMYVPETEDTEETEET